MPQDFEVRLDPTDEARLVRDIRDFPKELQKATRKRLRDISKPLGQLVIREGAATLPRRGGLANRVAQSKVSVATTTGRTAGIRLRMKTPEGYDLAGMDKGEIRHPVFAQPGWEPRWVAQPVRAEAFTTPFQRHARLAAAAVEKALTDAGKTITAGEAS